MKPVRTRLAVLILLVLAACGRQPGKAAAGDTVAGDAGIISQDDGSSVAHDPHAMTSIDVATGDLSGLANYGGGLAVVPRASHAGAAAEQSAAASLPPEIVNEPVTAAEQNGQASTAVPPTTENAVGETEHAAGGDTVQPAP